MRVLLRIIGFLCVAAGFVALVVDGTRAVANDAWTPTPLREIAARTFPAAYPTLEPTVTRNLHPLLWDPFLVNVLNAPAFAVALVLGFMLMILARSRREPVGFSTKR